MESSEFVEWLKGKGFIDSSIAKITGEEFSKADELLWLTKDDIDRLNLKLAQRKLLENIISSQGSPVTHDTPVSTYRKTEDLSPSEMLDQGLESLSLDKDELFDSMPKRRSDRVQLTHERKTSRDIGQLEKERLQEIRVVIVGERGAGKSSTANTLIGEEIFFSRMSSTCQTRSWKSYKCRLSNLKMTIVDTQESVPSSMSKTDMKIKETSCAVDGDNAVHAILYVIRIGRFTEEDKKALDRFLDYWGSDALKYMIAVFTRLDDLHDEEMNIGEFLSESDHRLRKFLTHIDNRYVAVNNKKKNKDTFILEIQKKVLKLVEENGGTCFTSEIMKKTELLFGPEEGETLASSSKSKSISSNVKLLKVSAVTAIVALGPGALVGGPVGAGVCGIIGATIGAAGYRLYKIIYP